MEQHKSNTNKVEGNDNALAKSLDRLKETISATVPGHEREWAEAVGAAIDAVEIAMRQHKASAKASDGVLAEVDETRPTLSRQADEIRQEHGDLLKDIASLRKEVFRAAVAFGPNGDPSQINPSGGVLDFGEIRRHAESILNQLSRTSEAETKLVQESVNTDIGVGD
jgi:hypothetical protein